MVFRGEGSESHAEGVPSLQHHFCTAQNLTTPTVGREQAPGTVVSLSRDKNVFAAARINDYSLGRNCLFVCS